MAKLMTDAFKNIILPQSLDNFLFSELQAIYSPTCKNMVALNYTEEDLRKYLGTYFPRSYAEAVYIFDTFFKKNKLLFSDKTELNIFDFCCGTGGEAIGLLTAIEDNFPHITTVHLSVLDGNTKAIRLFERIFAYFVSCKKLNVECKPMQYKIEDRDDLLALKNILRKNLDIILTFKAVCEFATRQRFESQNPYQCFAKFMLPYLSETGFICIEDITSRNEVANKWIPDMIAEAIDNSSYTILDKNYNARETVVVSHSHRTNDNSKIVWRLFR